MKKLSKKAKIRYEKEYLRMSARYWTHLVRWIPNN